MAQAREVPFAKPPAISATADGARSVFAGDVDGDGDIDALSASTSDNKIAWYENDGTGSGWALHTISSTANGAFSIFALDVDGDGDLDALSASYGNDTIAWYENDGTGGGWALHTISTTADGAHSVFAADVDGDGDLDALSASTIDNKIAWYENDGTGGTWTLHTISATANGARSVFALDVDGDGDLDTLSASSGDNKIAWYENDGTGGGWAPHTITVTADTAISVFAADVDGDGDLDALSASYGNDTIAWYENDGTGGTWTLHTISTTANGAFSVFALDVDGDGDLDTLSGSYADDTINWFRNDTIHRSAAFSGEMVISNSTDGAYAVAAADVDGDGDMDALAMAAFSNSLLWYENTAGDGSSWAVNTISSSARELFVSDLDGDGDADVLSGIDGAGTSDDGVIWHENTAGDGSNWAVHTISIIGDNITSVYASDLDGDGDQDALATFGNGHLVAWYENTAGDGSSWTIHTITTSNLTPRSLFVADMDGDGDRDVLLGYSSDDTVAWYENTAGDGSSWVRHVISTRADGAFSVFAADVDGDGDLDALSASSYDDKIAWYENTAGDGSSWIANTISTTVNGARSVFAADVDGDGDLDAVSASLNDDKIAWYENTAGNGSAWNTRVISLAANNARSVFAADMDGDGDLDALSASLDDDKIAWYENRGGQFALPTLDIAQKIASNGQTLDLLDIQAIHRGRMGDSDAELVTLELKLTDGAGVDLTSAEANGLIEELRVHLDDGSGVFEGAPPDTVVHTVSSFSLTAGVQTVIFGEGNANAQLPFGSPKVYFVVADITADADTQTPSAFQVGHITESSSTGEDAPNDIPLTLEFWPNTGTGVVDTTLDSTSCEAPFDLELSNRTVTTTVACEAGTFIRAGDSFVVDSGGALSLSAGETIRFTSGFHVDEGTLTVTIEPALQP